VRFIIFRLSESIVQVVRHLSDVWSDVWSNFQPLKDLNVLNRLLSTAIRSCLLLYLPMLPNAIISIQMQPAPTMFAESLKGSQRRRTTSAISCTRAYWVILSYIHRPSPLSTKLSRSSTLVATTMRFFLHSGRPFLTVTSVPVSDLRKHSPHADRGSVKKYKGRTPKGSSHPSRPSFDKTKDEMLAAIKEAPRNHPSAKEQVSW
jgi:hypothetical protein